VVHLYYFCIKLPHPFCICFTAALLPLLYCCLLFAPALRLHFSRRSITAAFFLPLLSGCTSPAAPLLLPSFSLL
jgi:hypothetical protein